MIIHRVDRDHSRAARQNCRAEEIMAKLAFDTGGTFHRFCPARRRGRIASAQGVEHAEEPGGGGGAGRDRAARAFRQRIDLAQTSGAWRHDRGHQRRARTQGRETGFISTAGFQDMLRIRNEGRYDLYDLNLRYPEPLVTRANSFGAEERMTADGAVVTELEGRRYPGDRPRGCASEGHQIRRGLPAARLQIPKARTAHCRAAA